VSPFLLFSLKVAGAGAPIAVLAYFLRVYPHRPFIYLAAVPGVLSIGLLFGDAVWWPLVVADGIAVAVAAFDVMTLPSKRALTVERSTVRVASLGKRQPVTLTLTNHSEQSFFVWVRDGIPHELEPEPAEARLALAPRARSTIVYRALATRRGSFSLETVHVRVRSQLGFWHRVLVYDVSSVIHVYPDMKQMAEYSLLARTNRLNQLGVRRSRRVGQDNEFERLRDFTRDDNYKHIDWRSTARRRKLTVKDFQANQSQRLIFLIDCGRMMTNEAAGLSLLDHAFNAMLMLSHVALLRGDSVGLLCFSDSVHTYLPPAGGSRQMNRLLHGSFDRFPRMVESRYDEAFLYLASHCRKRSLVVLMSNLIDEVNALQVEQYLTNLVGRHLPLAVLLRDRRIFDAADVERPQGPGMYRAAAAASILTWRHRVFTDLQSKGVLAIDVFPEELTAPLVNRYLDIKARHLL